MKNAAEKNVTEVRIVEAAVQLFSRQGYKGTSTREIAHLAGLNEATLFRYFARKADLFWAAAESRLNRLKLGRELQNGMATDMDPEVVLPMLVDFVVKEISEDSELMRLLVRCRLRVSGIRTDVSRSPWADFRFGECLLQPLCRPWRYQRPGADLRDLGSGGGGQRAPESSPVIYRSRLASGWRSVRAGLCTVLAECVTATNSGDAEPLAAGIE